MDVQEVGSRNFHTKLEFIEICELILIKIFCRTFEIILMKKQKKL